jgi:hypothetical protein
VSAWRSGDGIAVGRAFGLLIQIFGYSIHITSFVYVFGFYRCACAQLAVTGMTFSLTTE